MATYFFDPKNNLPTILTFWHELGTKDSTIDGKYNNNSTSYTDSTGWDAPIRMIDSKDSFIEKGANVAEDGRVYWTRDLVLSEYASGYFFRNTKYIRFRSLRTESTFD